MSSSKNPKDNGSARSNEKNRSGSSSNISEITFVPASNSETNFDVRSFSQSGPSHNHHHFRGSSVQPPARSSYQYSSYQSGYNFDNMNVNNYDFVASKQKFPSFNSLSFDSVNNFNNNYNYNYSNGFNNNNYNYYNNLNSYMNKLHINPSERTLVNRDLSSSTSQQYLAVNYQNQNNETNFRALNTPNLVNYLPAHLTQSQTNLSNPFYTVPNGSINYPLPSHSSIPLNNIAIFQQQQQQMQQQQFPNFSHAYSSFVNSNSIYLFFYFLRFL